MTTSDAEDASPSPDYSGDQDGNDMAEQKGQRASGDASPAQQTGNGQKLASNAKDPLRPRRKKARRACYACQRAHLTCGTLVFQFLHGLGFEKESLSKRPIPSLLDNFPCDIVDLTVNIYQATNGHATGASSVVSRMLAWTASERKPSIFMTPQMKLSCLASVVIIII